MFDKHESRHILTSIVSYPNAVKVETINIAEIVLQNLLRIYLAFSADGNLRLYVW